MSKWEQTVEPVFLGNLNLLLFIIQSSEHGLHNLFTSFKNYVVQYDKFNNKNQSYGFMWARP